MFDPETGAMLGEYGRTLPVMWALRDSGLSTHEKIVLFCLMSRARPRFEVGWIAHPSYACLSLDTGLSRSAVIRAVNHLRERELLTVADRDIHEVNTYVLDYAAIQKLPPNPKRTSRARKFYRS